MDTRWELERCPKEATDRIQKCIPFMVTEVYPTGKKQFTSSPFSMYALADLGSLSSGSVVLTTIYAITRKELRSCGVKLAFGLF